MDPRFERDLMRHLDGELPPGRARRVVARLAEDPVARARLADMEALGMAVRVSGEAAAGEADLSPIWAGVRAGIAREEPPGAWARLVAAVRGHALAVGAAAALVAIVAVAALLLLPGGARPVRNDAVVESLDVGPGAMATIFKVPDDDDPDAGETTVIWVSEAARGASPAAKESAVEVSP